MHKQQLPLLVNGTFFLLKKEFDTKQGVQCWPLWPSPTQIQHLSVWIHSDAFFMGWGPFIRRRWLLVTVRVVTAQCSCADAFITAANYEKRKKKKRENPCSDEGETSSRWWGRWDKIRRVSVPHFNPESFSFFVSPSPLVPYADRPILSAVAKTSTFNRQRKWKKKKKRDKAPHVVLFFVILTRKTSLLSCRHLGTF